MQKEQVTLLTKLAIKVLQDAHKFPSEPNTSTIYRSDIYPEFSISVQNKSIDDTHLKYNIWFLYDLVTPYGTFQPSIRFRYTKEDGVRLMSTYIKHFNLDALLPIYSYIIEKYEL